jgi:hypothetical protein
MKYLKNCISRKIQFHVLFTWAEEGNTFCWQFDYACVASHYSSDLGILYITTQREREKKNIIEVQGWNVLLKVKWHFQESVASILRTKNKPGRVALWSTLSLPPESRSFLHRLILLPWRLNLGPHKRTKCVRCRNKQEVNATLLAPLRTENYAPHSPTVWCPQQRPS